MIDIKNELAEKNADCLIGILIMEKVQSTPQNDLKAMKRELEAELGRKYGQTERFELKALHPMDAYIAYYKKFGYTYHVLQQVESVAKGKAIPDALPPVEAMFMAELKNMLLTAGHDLDKIRVPLKISVSAGTESYTTLGGRDVTSVPGDIMISDCESVISSILRGPDRRTPITEQTSRAIYTVYAPAGVEKQLVERHLKDIETYVRAGSEEAETSLLRIY